MLGPQNIRAFARRAHGAGPHREAGSLQMSEGRWNWGGPYVPGRATARRADTQERPRDHRGRGGSRQSTQRGTPGARDPREPRQGLGWMFPQRSRGRCPRPVEPLDHQLPRFPGPGVCQFAGTARPRPALPSPAAATLWGEGLPSSGWELRDWPSAPSPRTLRSAQARDGVLPQAPGPRLSPMPLAARGASPSALKHPDGRG